MSFFIALKHYNDFFYPNSQLPIINLLYFIYIDTKFNYFIWLVCFWICKKTYYRSYLKIIYASEKRKMYFLYADIQ